MKTLLLLSALTISMTANAFAANDACQERVRSAAKRIYNMNEGDSRKGDPNELTVDTVDTFTVTFYTKGLGKISGLYSVTVSDPEAANCYINSVTRR